MLGPERFDPPPSIRGAGVLPLSVTIPGPPHGKGRPRVVDGVAHTPKATKDWERHACSCFANAWGGMPHPGPLRVVVRSVKARRKTDPKTGGRFLSTVKPDLDNVVKAVLDAMERAGLFTGDQVVAMISASKWHAASWEGPCVEVEMMEAQG
jgi:Holliday junction resolvase RusA-like endonuclease